MNVVESRYNGTFSTFETVQETDPETNITKETEVPVYEDRPCRLDIDTSPATVDANGAPAIAQAVTLLCSPALIINPGTKIVVTQNGRTATYTASGMPVVYPSHQEIALVSAERWA